jgi:hypothetical protein
MSQNMQQNVEQYFKPHGNQFVIEVVKVHVTATHSTHYVTFYHIQQELVTHDM